MSQSIAQQKSAGASIQPWRTPDVVWNTSDIPWGVRTRAVVPVCKSRMCWRRNGGMPDPRSAFHSATLLTESNADLISIYATWSCLLKFRFNSANNLKASSRPSSHFISLQFHSWQITKPWTYCNGLQWATFRQRLGSVFGLVWCRCDNAPPTLAAAHQTKQFIAEQKTIGAHWMTKLLCCGMLQAVLSSHRQ